MTVTVPSNEKTGAAQLQAQITTLSTRTDSQSVQLLAQRQAELVQCLLGQNKLNASGIISAMPVAANAKRNPLYAAITAQSALVTKYGANPPAYAAAATLDQLQRQLLIEEMISGARTAASILSTMTYSGGAAQ